MAGELVAVVVVAHGHEHAASIPLLSSAGMKVRLVHEFRFEAAHWLPNVPDEHKCRRMHGHSYRIELSVFGEVDPLTGWLVDFADLEGAWRPLYERLDHRTLNDLTGLENPTSEVLAHWLWQQLRPRLPQLERVTVWETAAARCEYEGA